MLERLSKQVNKELSNLSNWLRANKLSLNMKKTELTDEHLLWNKKIAQIKLRVNRAIGVLRKLRVNASFDILKTACHSLFESHLQYGT